MSISAMSMLQKSVAALAATFLLAVPALAGPPSYTIDISVSGSGTVQLDPPKSAYKKNNAVNVMGVPVEDGWQFDHWEGDLAGDVNPITIRVSGDHSIVAVFVEGGGGGTDPPTDPPPAIRESGLIVGYFVQWGIYRRDYVPSKIVTSGTAERVDIINYAFAGIDENLQCTSIDEFADFEKRFDSNETVDGVADTVPQPLKGNFNQLRKLKQLYPHIRVLLSIGGWTESARFSDAALPANRAAFVASCIDKFIYGNIAPGISAAGVFDGLDIDWEYPGRCGATCDFRPEDGVNFTALLAEFRQQLNEAELNIGASQGVETDLLLTIAAPASTYNAEPIEIAAIHPFLDWINLMTYDFHGGWESNGPTNHHAHLRPTQCDDVIYDTWAEQSVDLYLNANVPTNKLLLGVPFYGRGWRGVPAVNDGFCQAARGVPRGTYEKGVDDYPVLAATSAPSFYDEYAGAHWTFDGQEYWSFDDPLSMQWKADFVIEKQMRGTMFWEMSGDSDTGDLVRALRNAFDAPP
jgi:chitinase